MLARISWTGGDPLVIHVVPGDRIVLPAGDGVRPGIGPRTKLEILLMVVDEGGVGARIGADMATPRGPRLATVVGPGGRGD